MSDVAPAAATAPTDPAPAAPEAAAPATPSTAGTQPPASTGEAAAPAAEPEKVAPPEPQKQPDFVRQAFARLTEEKSKLRRERESMREVTEKAARFDALLQRWQEDPGSIEEVLGEDAFERLVAHFEKAGRPASPEDRVTALERKLAEQEAARQKAEDERKTAEGQAAIQRGVAKVTESLKAAGETYELINLNGKHELVFNTMVEYANLHPEQVRGMAPGELMRIAASAVEKDLEKNEADRLERLKQSKKFSARFAAPPQQPNASDSPTGASATPGSVTLTSRAQSEAPPQQPARELSREDSLAETTKWLSQQLRTSVSAV